MISLSDFKNIIPLSLNNNINNNIIVKNSSILSSNIQIQIPKSDKKIYHSGIFIIESMINNDKCNKFDNLIVNYKYHF